MKRGLDILFAGLLRQHDDLRSGNTLQDLPGGFDAVDQRQSNIEHNQIGLQLFGLRDSRVPVFDRRYHVELRFEQAAQRLPD